MVDVRTESKTNQAANAKPVNPRQAIREARQRRLKLITNSGGKPNTIKVYAANDAMREVLRHPSGRSGIRFREKLDQGVEWPNDSFTSRRLAEGSIRTSPADPSSEYVEPDESLNPRQQTASRMIQDARPGNGEKPELPGNGEKPEATLRLAKLSPNTAVAGSAADIVMSCIGTGFTKDTVIKFGAYDEPTTFVSATEVTTGVKPSLFVNPDTVPVLVHTGEVSSEPINFTFTASEAQPKAAPKPTAR